MPWFHPQGAQKHCFKDGKKNSKVFFPKDSPMVTNKAEFVYLRNTPIFHSISIYKTTNAKRKKLGVVCICSQSKPRMHFLSRTICADLARHQICPRLPKLLPYPNNYYIANYRIPYPYNFFIISIILERGLRFLSL